MGASNWVHLDVLHVLKETKDAMLLVIAEVDDEVWIPKSQMEDPTSYKEGDVNCTISVSEWIIEQKGLEELL